MYVLVLFVLLMVRFNNCQLPPDILRDSFLTTPQLIETYGYPSETHSVQTQDGYVLEMHRIPHGVCTAAAGAPVLVMHGLLASSADWVVTLPGRALGYVLADAGYDVWLGNFRGNTYSRKHVRFAPNSKDFWNFSWHESGMYDLPAMIDYVLNQTQSRQLFYVGHSMGTTSFYIMASSRPEYNSKVRVMCSMAPVAYMNNIKSQLLRRLAFTNRKDEILLNALGVYEFLPNTNITDIVGRKLCEDRVPTQEICSNILFLLAGWDSRELNRTQLPVILSHVPAGASTKQILHYGQEVVSGYFRQWDYGFRSNIQIYGTIVPPQYNLSRITTPIALIYSDNDWLSSIIDVRRLNAGIRSSIGIFRVPYDKFNHLDYTCAINAKTLVYDTVISFFRQFA